MPRRFAPASAIYDRTYRRLRWRVSLQIAKLTLAATDSNNSGNYGCCARFTSDRYLIPSHNSFSDAIVGVLAPDGRPRWRDWPGSGAFFAQHIAVVWALSGRVSAAEPLRLITDHMLPYEDLNDDKEPGFSVEVLRQVFAAMGQDASFETLPWNRSWLTVARGERDGMFTVLRTNERERICSFPDEPLKQQRWVFFVRTADVGRLKFSSFDDLVGHDVAVHGPVPGVFEQPTVSAELWKFLREHHNMVETIRRHGQLSHAGSGSRRLPLHEPLHRDNGMSPRWDYPERLSRYCPAA